MLIVKAPGIELTFPSSWEEVTLNQFLTLHHRMRTTEEGDTEYDLIPALEAFASDIKLLHQLDAAESYAIIERLPFIKDMPYFETLPVPASILGVTPPTELGTCRLAQKLCIQGIITDRIDNEEPVDYIAVAIPILSIYLYPLLTGLVLTDVSELEAITERVLAAPCVEALPLSAFFLANYTSRTSTGQTSYQLTFPKARPSGSLMRWFRSLRLTPITRWFVRSPKIGA